MKTLLLLTLLSIVPCRFASGGSEINFDDDCIITRGQIETVYEILKPTLDIQVTITSSGKTVWGVKWVIDLLEYKVLTQMCMNAQYAIHLEGAEYYYKKYTTTYGALDKTYFDANQIMVMMLMEVRKQLDNR